MTQIEFFEKAKLAKREKQEATDPRFLSDVRALRGNQDRLAAMNLNCNLEELIMRKKFTFCLPILLCAGALIAPAGFAAEKSNFTASEVFNPFGILPGVPAVGEFVYPGTVECPGYEPTGNPEQPCPAVSRTHVRNAVIISQIYSLDARVTGLMTVELNQNWDTDFEGPTWGTFSFAVDSGGTWEGTWQVLRERVAEDVDEWTGTIHVIGKGYGGIVDGMKMMAEDRVVSFTPMPIAYLGHIEGRIVDPN